MINLGLGTYVATTLKAAASSRSAFNDCATVCTITLRSPHTKLPHQCRRAPHGLLRVRGEPLYYLLGRFRLFASKHYRSSPHRVRATTLLAVSCFLVLNVELHCQRLLQILFCAAGDSLLGFCGFCRDSSCMTQAMHAFLPPSPSSSISSRWQPDLLLLRKKSSLLSGLRQDLSIFSSKSNGTRFSFVQRNNRSGRIAAVLDIEQGTSGDGLPTETEPEIANGEFAKVSNGKPFSENGFSRAAVTEVKGPGNGRTEIQDSGNGRMLIRNFGNVSGSVSVSGIEVDAVSEAELKENGFRSTRRTKLVCTIGPASCEFHQLETLASGGMNVARINMCHGTREWHRSVIRSVRKLNVEKGYAVAIMMDTEGSEIHMGDFGGASSVKAEDGEIWTFTVRAFEGSPPDHTIQVNYDGFTEDVRAGDELMVDGGMVCFEVVEKIGPDVKCRCTDPGLLLPRANLTFWRGGRVVRERNAMLPTISSKDWLDIDFGISEGVDFIAISFVKSAEVIKHLKSYLAARSLEGTIRVIAKIESSDSLKHLEDIIRVSDGAMVARGDLGAQILLEQVPSVQQQIVHLCRQLNKPVIVASQLLESMIEYPTPTRAEVADVSEAVKQRADALMLSGESAMGVYPEKALSVLRTVSLRIEKWWRQEKRHPSMHLVELSESVSDRISEEICISAAQMANNLAVDAIFVYTREGDMASLLSRCRPDCPIFAFTPSTHVRRCLNLQWGLIPFRLDFTDDMESNLNRTFALLKARGMVKPGDLVIAVSDMLQSIQVMRIP